MGRSPVDGEDPGVMVVTVFRSREPVPIQVQATVTPLIHLPVAVVVDPVQALLLLALVPAVTHEQQALGSAGDAPSGADARPT